MVTLEQDCCGNGKLKKFYLKLVRKGIKLGMLICS